MSARVRLAGIGAVVTLVALTGCSGGGDSAGSSPTSTPPSASASASGPDEPTASGSPIQADGPGYDEPAVGECRRLSGSDIPPHANTDKPMSCAKPHTARVYAVARVPKAVPINGHPPKLIKQVIQVCGRGFQKAAGGTPELRARSVLSWGWFRPTAAQQQHGAHWFRCDLIASAGADLARLPAGKGPVIRRHVPPALLACLSGRGQKLPCRQPHDFRVSGSFLVPPTGGYPSQDRLQALADARCPQLVATTSWYWFAPGAWNWLAGDRTIGCYSQLTD